MYCVCVWQPVFHWHNACPRHPYGGDFHVQTKTSYTSTEHSSPLLTTPTHNSVSSQSATPTPTASSVTSQLTSSPRAPCSRTVECRLRSLNDFHTTIAPINRTGHVFICMSTTTVYQVGAVRYVWSSEWRHSIAFGCQLLQHSITVSPASTEAHALQAATVHHRHTNEPAL